MHMCVCVGVGACMRGWGRVCVCVCRHWRVVVLESTLQNLLSLAMTVLKNKLERLPLAKSFSYVLVHG
jgi:hypothetical protein